jgi:hypothetical protein
MKKNKSHKSTGKPDHFLLDGRQKNKVNVDSEILAQEMERNFVPLIFNKDRESLRTKI